LSYDLKLAEDITKAGQKYLNELRELHVTLNAHEDNTWSDMPKPKTSLQKETARTKNKINWSEIFERYTKEVPDWETNKLMPLTEWHVQNYQVPYKK